MAVEDGQAGLSVLSRSRRGKKTTKCQDTRGNINHDPPSTKQYLKDTPFTSHTYPCVHAVFIGCGLIKLQLTASPTVY